MLTVEQKRGDLAAYFDLFEAARCVLIRCSGAGLLADIPGPRKRAVLQGKPA